jgi:hypothetical protein
MNNIRNISLSFLIIFIFSVNVHASISIDKTKQLDSKGYKLCQNDADIDDQSDIYQEPAQETDGDNPADIYKQPDDNQNNTDNSIEER